MKPRSKILIIAGSDSSGGAGIQADIKTVTSLGSYAMTAVTAITSQNTTGVKSVVPINPKEIEKQILFTCKDIKPNAIKIGMLHSTIVINSVIKVLKKIKVSKVILDPGMVAKGGAKLIKESAIKNLKSKLISKVFLITPNPSNITKNQPKPYGNTWFWLGAICRLNRRLKQLAWDKSYTKRPLFSKIDLILFLFF